MDVGMRAIDRYEINTNLKIVCFDFGSGGDCLIFWGSGDPYPWTMPCYAMSAMPVNVK